MTFFPSGRGFNGTTIVSCGSTVTPLSTCLPERFPTQYSCTPSFPACLSICIEPPAMSMLSPCGTVSLLTVWSSVTSSPDVTITMPSCGIVVLSDCIPAHGSAVDADDDRFAGMLLDHVAGHVDQIARMRVEIAIVAQQSSQRHVDADFHGSAVYRDRYLPPMPVPHPPATDTATGQRQYHQNGDECNQPMPSPAAPPVIGAGSVLAIFVPARLPRPAHTVPKRQLFNVLRFFCHVLILRR